MTDREMLEDISRRLVKIEGELGAIPEVQGVRRLVESYAAYCRQQDEAKEGDVERGPLGAL